MIFGNVFPNGIRGKKIIENIWLTNIDREYRRDLINEILIQEPSDLFDMLIEHLFLFDS